MIWLYFVRPSTMCHNQIPHNPRLRIHLWISSTTTYLLQTEYIIKLVNVCTQCREHGVLLTARYLLQLELIIELSNLSIEQGEDVNSS